jgi:hypothetical protein
VPALAVWLGLSAFEQLAAKTVELSTPSSHNADLPHRVGRESVDCMVICLIRKQCNIRTASVY